MLDSWRCFFLGFFGKPINFPVDLYGGLRGKSRDFWEGVIVAALRLERGFGYCCIRTRVITFLQKCHKFGRVPKSRQPFFRTRSKCGYINWRLRWPCEKENHLGHLETTNLGSSMLRGGIGHRQVEFLQKRMDENPQYQGLVAFTNLHDPGGLRLVGSHQVDVCHEFLTVSYFMYIVRRIWSINTNSRALDDVEGHECHMSSCDSVGRLWSRSMRWSCLWGLQGSWVRNWHPHLERTLSLGGHIDFNMIIYHVYTDMVHMCSSYTTYSWFWMVFGHSEPKRFISVLTITAPVISVHHLWCLLHHRMAWDTFMLWPEMARPTTTRTGWVPSIRLNDMIFTRFRTCTGRCLLHNLKIFTKKLGIFFLLSRLWCFFKDVAYSHIPGPQVIAGMDVFRRVYSVVGMQWVDLADLMGCLPCFLLGVGVIVGGSSEDSFYRFIYVWLYIEIEISDSPWQLFKQITFHCELGSVMRSGFWQLLPL